jgi:hypothetical protein
MKKTRIAKIGVAVAFHYRRAILRLTGKAARHPKRTAHVAKGGKLTFVTARRVKSSPEAQRRAKIGAGAAASAVRRARKLGADARTDGEVLHDLLTAVQQISAAATIVQEPPPQKKHHGKRLLVGTAIIAGAGVTAARLRRPPVDSPPG